MSLFNKPFPEGTKCQECNKDMNDLASGRLQCSPCWNRTECWLANKTVIGHLWQVFIAIFNFEFVAALGGLIWATQRLFKVGDYHPKTGNFYIKGYLKRKPSKSSSD